MIRNIKSTVRVGYVPLTGIEQRSSRV